MADEQTYCYHSIVGMYRLKYFHLRFPSRVASCLMLYIHILSIILSSIFRFAIDRAFVLNKMVNIKLTPLFNNVTHVF